MFRPPQYGVKVEKASDDFIEGFADKGTNDC
jgi:hypothetical protein